MEVNMWKDVKGYEGIYTVSDDGFVKNKLGKILKTWNNNSRYECVTLYNNGVKKNHLIHRIVGRAFCEGYSEELDIDHINNNRLDNRAVNLRWVTRKENIADCVTRGVNSIAYARTHIDNTRKVAMIDPSTGDTLKVFNSVKEAESYVGSKSGGITRVAKNHKGRKTCKGFGWKYVE